MPRLGFSAVKADTPARSRCRGDRRTPNKADLAFHSLGRTS
jgi:hypothetical protein